MVEAIFALASFTAIDSTKFIIIPITNSNIVVVLPKCSPSQNLIEEIKSKQESYYNNNY